MSQAGISGAIRRTWTSLAFRLSLLLTGAVGATIILAWMAAGNAVIGPFAREVFEGYLDEVVYVADQVAAGTSPVELGRKLGLDIEVSTEPPLPRAGARRTGPWGRPGCVKRTRSEHELVICQGRRAPVAVSTPAGWVLVRRDLDVNAPRRQIGRFLALIAVGVLAAAVWVAVAATRPLRAAKAAMDRVAAGELSHRLPTDGPREIAEAARAFNAMATRVEEMLRTERALMAGMSHELRTPLARLRLETELLREKGLPESRLTAMEGDLAEIDGLIGELLEMSRLELGERTLTRQPVDLRRIAEEAAERSGPARERVRIEGSAAPVEGDHDRLVRVVSNLIENAVKYAPPGSEITVRLAGRAVEVLDRGPGVPPSALPRLFEPFYRVAARDERRTPGLGLGLMIAHQIVGLHGGHIAAENRPDGGLAVRFDLPA